MKKIGLFYGTDTGNTEVVSKDLKKKLEAILGADTVDLKEIYKKKKEDFEAYDILILGMPLGTMENYKAIGKNLFRKWNK
jgi:flavodoxin I